VLPLLSPSVPSACAFLALYFAFLALNFAFDPLYLIFHPLFWRFMALSRAFMRTTPVDWQLPTPLFYASVHQITC
jgi:hypothetical protein